MALPIGSDGKNIYIIFFYIINFLSKVFFYHNLVSKTRSFYFSKLNSVYQEKNEVRNAEIKK